VGAEKFGVRWGKIINRYSVAKHFLLLITDNSLSYERKSEKMEAEAHLGHQPQPKGMGQRRERLTTF
jgi:hypothetical protein